MSAYALSELERDTLLQRQKEGIAVAMERGINFGRPPLKKPTNWEETLTDWKEGKIQTVEAIQVLGMARSSFYKQVRLARSSNR